MNNSKVSVCIPFYNIEPYVSRCLDSVLNNTYKNLEVICVNDGSTDGTSALLHEYAKKDPRVIVVDKENGGIVSARSAGIDIVTGDFISFIDGDDWVHHQFFEILMSVQEKTNADTVVCGYVKTEKEIADNKIDLNNVLSRSCDLDHIYEEYDAHTLIWGRIYSTELISNIKIDSNITIGEDAALNLLLLCQKDETKIAIITEKLYYYFQRTTSAVHTIPHHNRIKVSDYFVKHFDDIKSSNGQGVIIHEIMHSMFSCRYLTMLSPERKIVKKHYRELYNFCKNRWNPLLSFKDRMKYTILYYCPFIYRLFRIITDPTMLDWERAEKKRQREKWAQ